MSETTRSDSIDWEKYHNQPVTSGGKVTNRMANAYADGDFQLLSDEDKRIIDEELKDSDLGWKLKEYIFFIQTRGGDLNEYEAEKAQLKTLREIAQQSLGTVTSIWDFWTKVNQLPGGKKRPSNYPNTMNYLELFKRVYPTTPQDLIQFVEDLKAETIEPKDKVLLTDLIIKLRTEMDKPVVIEK